MQSQVSDSDYPSSAADLVQLPSFLHLLLFLSLHHLRILCLEIDLLCFCSQHFERFLFFIIPFRPAQYGSVKDAFSTDRLFGEDYLLSSLRLES